MFRALFLTVALVIAPFSGLANRSVRAADAPELRYFAEATGHTIADPFLSRWIAENGAVTLGDPITEPVELYGKTVQFFKYGLLAHGSSKTARQPAGATLLALDVQAHSPNSGRRDPSPIDVGGGQSINADPGQNGVVWSDKTRHTISGSILSYYSDHGGSDSFGQPISEPYVSGGFTMQWFEYGRIEVAQKGGAVSPAPVGYELARRLGVDSKTVNRGGLPVFLASRFAKFQGDGTIPEATGIFEPVEIMIPAISVDAKIEQVDIVDGAMGTPQDAWNVGWYPQISWPGEYTNVVMAGHRDWWGIGPTVFYNLPDLAPGEMIYLVGANGKGATYKITDSYSVGSDTNAGDVVGDTGSDILTLITCDGSFDGAEYASRQIIRAERI
jgi:LPXTG-site transpeptidase (sortase) family protein